MRRATVSVHIVTLLLLAVLAPAQNNAERLLSDAENAYNPIASPDGKLIAYVRTGWGREGGSGGFGRSNLRSEIAVMTLSGKVLSPTPVANGFLSGWTPGGNDIICYRDGHFMLVGPYGGFSRQADETGIDREFNRSERVAYLSKADRFVWVEHQRSSRTVLLTQSGLMSENAMMTGAIVVPSPDERFIAVGGNGMDLWVYEVAKRKWIDLGKAVIHPDTDWDYIKPSWNPWFADSSRLAFFSESSLVVASPDGLHRTVVVLKKPAGLAVPSPDGKWIAYVTFTPRPMKIRPDLKFWGGSIIWLVSSDGKRQPTQITSPNEQTTYDLNWVGANSLVFDRIADTPFFSHARLWIASVSH